ncbi:septation protein IspZ [Parasutterella secunda]|uniref:Inner membrane-spanning protein YciB n=1 Tax=Parasutterella secunda TaxID=626947 RepID=A0ABS2GR51_9BURK|nr:septation protein IspZ [Parasutterella secunda]
MKAFFDLLPVICFFITFKLAGSYTAELTPIFPVTPDLIPIVSATAVIIIASLLQMGFLFIKGQKPSKMAVFSTVLVVLFGGMTIAFQDPAFIQWKPTLLYWLFAAILLFGRFGKKDYIKTVFTGITMPDFAWRKVENFCLVFLVAIGFINLFVAYSFSMDIWVDFKLFGLLGLTLLFTIGLGFYVAKYAEEAQNTKINH